MLETEAIDFHNHLPPYRSLLNPNARYDYRTHTLIPLTQNDLNFLQSFFRSGGRSTPIFSYLHYRQSRSLNNGSSRGSNGHNNRTTSNRSRTTTTILTPPQNSNTPAVSSSSLSDPVGNNAELSNSYIENAITLSANTGPQLLQPPSRSSSSSLSTTAASVTSNQPFPRVNYQNNQDVSTSTTFKMKYKSLLNDVGRSISMRLSNNNLLGNSIQSSSSNSIDNNHNNGIVSRSSTLLSSSVKRKSQPTITNIKQMPEEILDYIFYLVDCKSDYANCLHTCKLFYHMAKPYFYENLSFTSTYRFAQFISYLRLNASVGHYVKLIDLSGIKPGYDEDAEENNDQEEEVVEAINEEGETIPLNSREVSQLSKKKALAGWRDWKFKNNPLYTVHPYPAGNLTKIASNSQFLISSNRSNSSQKSSSTKRFTKPFKYFKTRKRSRSFSGNLNSRKAPKLETLNLNNRQGGGSSPMSNPHPLINKFLLNYSTSKDVPIGYVLHLINLCPNVCSLNLGGLSLSTDYEILRSSMCKYQTFDLMNNYPKDLLHKIDNSMKSDELDDVSSIDTSLLYNRYPENRFSRNLFKSNQTNTSTASSIYSVTTFSKPIRKYNSLLPPLPPTLADISYVKKGDRRVYLSDLNLKSINNAYLRKIDEREVLLAISRIHGKQVHSYKMQQIPGLIEEDVAGNLRYINLSSMIWLNRDLIEKFLKKLLVKRSFDLASYGYCGPDAFDDDSDLDFDSDLESVDDQHNPIAYKQDLVIDLSNSGMYKNLLWAKRIDLNTIEGCKLADKIIRNELLTPHEEFMRRERIRRGRIGENYLA